MEIDDLLSTRIRSLGFILTCMVVMIHSQCYHPLEAANSPDRDLKALLFLEVFLSEGISRVAVPFFFLISGALFCKDFASSAFWYLRKIKSRVRSLAVPFILWSAINFVLILVAQSLPVFRTYFDRVLISEMGLGGILLKLFWRPYCGQFWFIRDLFILVLLSPVIAFLITRIPRVFLTVVAVLWLLGLSPDDTGVSVEGLLFFSAGAFVAIRLSRVPSRIPHAKVLPVVWLALVLARATVFVGTGVNLLVVHKLSIVAGILALWFNCDEIVSFLRLDRYRVVRGYSFFIFAFHLPMMVVLNKLLLRTSQSSEVLRIAQYLTLPVVAIALSLAVGTFLKKSTPSLFGLLTGDR